MDINQNKDNNVNQHNLQQIDKQKFEACMILAAVGDAMGYKNGDWEFQKSGIIIHQQFKQLTKNQGIKNLNIDLKWRYSDDTVMHIATAQALNKFNINNYNLSELMQQMAIQYKLCWGQMSGRAPGKTTGKSIQIINQDGSNWNKIPFQDKAGGCGGSMRSACIGLCFKYPDQLDKLIQVSIESGRLTHHHPTGYLGALVSSLFTSLAFAQIPILQWPAILLQEVIPKAKIYIENSGREVNLNIKNFDFFINQWKIYLKLRSISLTVEQTIEPIFPKDYDQILTREQFYKTVSFRGWGGASGHDSVIIAYDALLSSKQDWEELCMRGVLHGGDNDTTGTIACAWYGAMKGFQGVPCINYKNVENHKLLFNLAHQLYQNYSQTNSQQQ